MTPRYFTNSELRTWQRCRRQWYVRHYLSLGPKKDPSDVSVSRLGTLFALGAETYYGGESPETALTVVEDKVIAQRTDLIQAEGDSSYKIAPLNKAGELVLIMLRGFFEWLEESGVDADLDFLGVEDRIEAPHPEIPGAVLLGKLDQRARNRSTGKVLTLDNKTCSTAMDQELAALSNPQFQHYGLIQRLNGDPIGGAEVRWARRVKRTAAAKPPFYGRVEIPLPDDLLRSYYRQVTGLIKEILEAEDKLRSGWTEDAVCGPNATRDNCQSCFARAVCPLFSLDADTETVLRYSFTPVDALARYREEEGTDE